jgi:hypothetical protein
MPSYTTFHGDFKNISRDKEDRGVCVFCIEGDSNLAHPNTDRACRRSTDKSRRPRRLVTPESLREDHLVAFIAWITPFLRVRTYEAR